MQNREGGMVYTAVDIELKKICCMFHESICAFNLISVLMHIPHWEKKSASVL